MFKLVPVCSKQCRASVTKRKVYSYLHLNNMSIFFSFPFSIQFFHSYVWSFCMLNFFFLLKSVCWTWSWICGEINKRITTSPSIPTPLQYLHYLQACFRSLLLISSSLLQTSRSLLLISSSLPCHVQLRTRSLFHDPLEESPDHLV